MVMIWVLEQFQTGFSKLSAGFLAWVSALGTGLTPEVQACLAARCRGPCAVPCTGSTAAAAVYRQVNPPGRKPRLSWSRLSTLHGCVSAFQCTRQACFVWCGWPALNASVIQIPVCCFTSLKTETLQNGMGMLLYQFSSK